MANRVFGQNNLRAVREKQAASRTNGLKPFFNFWPIDFVHVDRQLILDRFETSKIKFTTVNTCKRVQKVTTPLETRRVYN